MRELVERLEALVEGLSPKNISAYMQELDNLFGDGNHYARNWRKIEVQFEKASKAKNKQEFRKLIDVLRSQVMHFSDMLDNDSFEELTEKAEYILDQIIDAEEKLRQIKDNSFVVRGTLKKVGQILGIF